MIIQFDKEKLEKVLYDFYNLTKLTISLWDDEFNQLMYQPKTMPAFCRLIKSTKYGCKGCLQSDLKILKACTIAKKPCSHICHAGLIDIAVPILHDDIPAGYLMFGQIKYKDSTIDSEAVGNYAELAQMDYNLLASEYDLIRVIEPDYINSAIQILSLCTDYILVQHMIKINNSGLPAKIEAYVNEHLKEKITVSDICRQLYISKSKLYMIFNNDYNCTFWQYVIEKRLRKAKKMLINTDMSISEICEETGISDYNYFIKVFKKNTGYSPIYYRKNYPLLSEKKLKS